jgi:ribosomal protein S18 acetylase RimI-like enzyme
MTCIKKASLADVPELNILINKAYRGESSKKGWTTEAYLLDGLRIDEDILTGYITDESATVFKYLDNENKITGCIYLKQGTGRLYLGMLTVNPELQNAGIGRQLLAYADDYANSINCPKLWMTVISTRHELIAYYERKGFKVTGEKKPFPTDTRFGIQKQPLELIVMEKEV